MKYVLWLAGILVGLASIFGIVQTAASERVEVIQLYTTNQAGEEKITRLWIVDHEGFQYLRGEQDSGWFTRIHDNGEFQLKRNRTTMSYNFEIRPDKIGLINQLMQQKYTWGDTFFETMMGSREQSKAIELHPVTPQ